MTVPSLFLVSAGARFLNARSKSDGDAVRQVSKAYAALEICRVSVVYFLLLKGTIMTKIAAGAVTKGRLTEIKI
jgi:hypothetical protein